jgi:hypothetical protein
MSREGVGEDRHVGRTGFPQLFRRKRGHGTQQCKYCRSYRFLRWVGLQLRLGASEPIEADGGTDTLGEIGLRQIASTCDSHTVDIPWTRGWGVGAGRAEVCNITSCRGA